MDGNLAPLDGPISSPPQAHVRAQSLALVARRLDLDEAAPEVLNLSADGTIDLAATTAAAVQHNQLAANLAQEAAFHEVAVTLVAETATVVNTAAAQLMTIADVASWESLCLTGVDHATRSIGDHAVRCFRFVVRFGSLTYEDLYDLCGRTQGEKNCHKGIKRLVAEKFFTRLPNLDRKHLFGLHPRILNVLSSTGQRVHRDEAAIALARAAGRQVVFNRRQDHA